MATRRGATDNVEQFPRNRESRTQRPTFTVAAGGMHALVEQVDAFLGQAAERGELNLFRRAETLVEIVTTASGPAALEVGQVGLRHIVDGLVEFVRVDAEGNKTPTDTPRELVQRLMARLRHSRIPQLNGIVTAPTIATDGRLIADRGWDPETGIFVAPTVDTALPETVTRDDALKALATLRGPLRHVCFRDQAHESVVLAAALTAVIRPSLPTAPFFAISATAPGSGKGQLCRYVSRIATGREPSFMGQAGDEAELEKRLDSVMLAGDPVVVIDNCERPLRSDKLCSLLSERAPRVRQLGHSKVKSTVNSSTLLATGNTLQVAGDLVRRTLLCEIDVQTEDPSQRVFEKSIEQQACDQRAELVQAALTILKAHADEDWPDARRDMGSFENWSAWVRSALIWLGMPDPCLTQNALHAADPEREERHALVATWYTCVGSREVQARELITLAYEVGDAGELAYPDLHDALSSVCRTEKPKAGPLGRWLRQQNERIIELTATETGSYPLAVKIMKRRGRAGRIWWCLKVLGRGTD